MNFIINKSIEEIASDIASVINRELSLGKKVLRFVSGGSVVPIEVLVSKKIKLNNKNQLFVFLADERFGPIGHRNSNSLLLESSGFNIPKANIVPVLTGRNFLVTAKYLRLVLKDLFDSCDYKVGVFGIGADGHTSGIMPHSEAIHIDELVCAYETPEHDRVTITPKAINQIDEAFVYAVGENKWSALEKLKENIPIEEEPAQVLKKIPNLKIYTDYNK